MADNDESGGTTTGDEIDAAKKKDDDVKDEGEGKTPAPEGD